MTIVEEPVVIYDAATDGVRIDESPFSASTTDNWVARLGGLPPYIRGVTRGIMKSGHSFEDALPIAIGIMRTWARGGPTFGHKSHATQATMAKAANALKQWEQMKGEAAAGMSKRSSIERSFTRANIAGKGGGTGPALTGAYAPGHAFHGNQHTGPIVGPHKQKQPPTKKTKAQQQQQAHQTAHTSASKTAHVTASDTAQGIAPGSPQAQAAYAAVKNIQPVGGGQIPSTSSSGGSSGSSSSNAAANAASQAQYAAQQAAQAAQQQVQEDNAVMTSTASYNSAKDNAAIAAADAVTTQAQQKQNVQFAIAKANASRPYNTSSNNTNQANAVTELTSSQTVQAVQMQATAQDQQASESIQKADDEEKVAQSQLLAAMAAAGYRDGAPEGATRNTASNPEPLPRGSFLDLGQRDGMSSGGGPIGEATPGGAANFLPAGPSAAQDKRITKKLKDPQQRPSDRKPDKIGSTHWFVGQDEKRCEKCGEPVTSPVHEKVDEHGAVLQVTAPMTIASQYAPSGGLYGRAATDTHSFTGSDLMSCDSCSQPITASVHTAVGQTAKNARLTGEKAPGQPIPPMPREASLIREANARNFALVEGPLEAALKHHFADQQRSTINRLLGKRGGRMLKRALVALQDVNELVPGSQPAEIEPGIETEEVFDRAFWADKTAQIIEPHLATASLLARGAVKDQVAASDMDDSGVLVTTHQEMAARAHAAAQAVTLTTASALSMALQEGLSQGETREQIEARLNDVFALAQSSRAAQIARTTTVGGYNQAALTYARALPEGTVGTKVWLADVHDPATRTDHRMANGQPQSLDQPYNVGGTFFQYPGDPEGPLDEWINERCSMAFR